MNRPDRLRSLSLVALSVASLGGALGLRHAAASSPAPSPAGDPTIAAALTELASCDGKRISDDCAAREAWKKRTDAVEATDEDTPAGKSERARYAASCVANLRHASPGVREASAECAGELAAQVADRKAEAQVVLAQLAVDTSEGARTEQRGLLRRLNPTEHGLAGEVVALARPLVGKRASSSELAALVWALEPYAFGPELESAPEAVSFGLELLKRREAVVEALDVLAHVKAPSKDVCDAVIDVVATKRGAWAHALSTLGRLGEGCKAQHERGVAIVREVAERPGGPAKAHGLGGGADDVADFVERAALSKELKAKLSEAVGLAAKAGATPDELAKLREALGAK